MSLNPRQLYDQYFPKSGSSDSLPLREDRPKQMALSGSTESMETPRRPPMFSYEEISEGRQLSPERREKETGDSIDDELNWARDSEESSGYVDDEEFRVRAPLGNLDGREDEEMEDGETTYEGDRRGDEERRAEDGEKKGKIPEDGEERPRDSRISLPATVSADPRSNANGSKETQSPRNRPRARSPPLPREKKTPECVRVAFDLHKKLECLEDAQLRIDLDGSMEKAIERWMTEAHYPEDEEREVKCHVPGFVDLFAIGMACSEKPHGKPPEVDTETISKAKKRVEDPDLSERMQAASACKDWLEREFVAVLNVRPLPELAILPRLPEIMGAFFPKGDHYESAEPRFEKLEPKESAVHFEVWKKEGRSDCIRGEFWAISPDKSDAVFVVPWEGSELVQSMLRLVGVYRTAVTLAFLACGNMKTPLPWRDAPAQFFSRKVGGGSLADIFWTLIQTRWIVKLAFS